jgi:hypothetical protein
MPIFRYPILALTHAIVFVGSVVICQSCKKVENDSSSTVQHTFGKTKGFRAVPLESCAREASLVHDTSLTKSKNYVQKIFAELVKANNHVFRNILSPDKFCIAVLGENGRSASAKSVNGLISVQAGFLAMATSDAVVAAVIAHELAHVSRNHGIHRDLFLDSLTGSEKDLAKNLEDKIAARKTRVLFLYRALLAFEQVREKAAQEMPLKVKGLSEWEVFRWIKEYIVKNKLCKAKCGDFESLSEDYINSLESIGVDEDKLMSIYTKYITKEELANQTEADADEVGLEFLVRADIDPAAMKDLFYLFGKKDSKTDVFYCLESEERGSKKHPSHCWRARNAQLEMEKHQAQFAKYLKQKRKNFVSSPSLAEVKAEVAPGIETRTRLEKLKSADGAPLPFPK